MQSLDHMRVRRTIYLDSHEIGCGMIFLAIYCSKSKLDFVSKLVSKDSVCLNNHCMVSIIFSNCSSREDPGTFKTKTFKTKTWIRSRMSRVF